MRNRDAEPSPLPSHTAITGRYSGHEEGTVLADGTISVSQKLVDTRDLINVSSAKKHLCLMFPYPIQLWRAISGSSLGPGNVA